MAWYRFEKNPDAKIRIVVGQDESIYLPHALNKYFWTVEGHVPIRPKTDGMGIMISLLITREFGWTFNLTEDNLKEVLVIVNKKRNGQHYLNRKAAVELYGTTEKNTKNENTLHANPFYRDFEYGKTRSGY